MHMHIQVHINLKINEYQYQYHTQLVKSTCTAESWLSPCSDKLHISACAACRVWSGDEPAASAGKKLLYQ